MAKRGQEQGAGAQNVPESPAHFIGAARKYLQAGEQKRAYEILVRAVLHHPEHPLILSYYGCLRAIVDRKYRSGIESCRRGLQRFKPQDAYSAGIVYPILYLNLGRACVAAGRKKDAIDALHKGLRYDKGNRELKKELQLLGVRMNPVVPFLSRSNPINKYIGLVLHGSQAGTNRRSGR